MKKLKNILFVTFSSLLILCCVLLVRGFDGLLNRIGVFFNFQNTVDYQNGAFILTILCYLCCLTVALLVPTALVKLQYQLSFLDSIFFVVKRYALVYITLPLFIMRLICVDAWIPYIVDEGQIGNPLYHETLWRECAEWGSMAMVLLLIFWGCLMVMNLFGSLRYGYIAVNIAAVLCLFPMLYLSLDYVLVVKAQNFTLSILLLLTLIAVIVVIFYRNSPKKPPLRPFFAQADTDAPLGRKSKKWYDYK